MISNDTIGKTPTIQKANRLYYIDVIRVLGCLMVIMMHAPYPSEYSLNWFYGGITFITSPCVCLFFMISGYLLLPTKQSLFPFLKHRVGKFISSIIIWSVIYLMLQHTIGNDTSPILNQLLSIPFSPQGTGVLWFMYCLVGLYIVAPIVSPWLKTATRNEMKMLIALWIISLCFPIIGIWIEIRGSFSGILYYFSGFIGYFLLGYYIKQFSPRLNIWTILMLLVCLIGPFIIKFFNVDLFADIHLIYLNPFTAGMTYFIFLFLKNRYSRINTSCLNNRSYQIVISLSKCTFGIYLVHIGIMRMFLWNMPWFYNMTNCILQTFISFSVTLLLSWIFVAIINKFSFSKYIFA